MSLSIDVAAPAATDRVSPPRDMRRPVGFRRSFWFGIAAAAAMACNSYGGVRVGRFQIEERHFYASREGLPADDVIRIYTDHDRVVAVTAAGAARFESGSWVSVASSAAAGIAGLKDVRQSATATDGTTAAATSEGLFVKPALGRWAEVYPHQGNLSWKLRDVRGTTFDSRGRLWFASPQGAGVLDNGEWTLYTGQNGLPYDDFTTLAAGENGVVWFGTHRGAIRFDGKSWEYRQGLRWLPHDDIRGIAVDSHGNAWFATPSGVGVIRRRSMTLDEMAAYFEQEIDKRHRRTPYGYVDTVSLGKPGDTSKWTQHDSDNDGLWTAMYGAGECFAWAVTKEPAAKERARKAFEALRFLGQVTEGGMPAPPNGYVARSILPASGPDPNLVTDTPERDRRMQQTRDHAWKSLTPRWPKSADGQWFWKADTSSDELDGHYFFYANYFDLVADTPEEKARVRQHVAKLTDHLIEHGFQLVDHDGKVTRWGVFNPDKLNHAGQWWEERGLNSLSMLAYLRTAEHITGDSKYGRAFQELVDKHGYGANAAIAKTNAGPGSGNQSDDEMAFMNFYCLLRYEPDGPLKSLIGFAFRQRWTMEKFELNPLFNFLYAASTEGLSFEDAFRKYDLSPDGDWLQESIDTLKRYPLDRVNWALTNSHRKDIVLLPSYVRGAAMRGHLRDGRVLPIDERFVDKWNHDPWALDSRGDGRRLADGASFLLPYYLGRYLRFIE